jgi:predicted dinucleotide-binding enzyme
VVAGGNEVELIDRNPDDARALADELGDKATVADSPSGEIVVLALPYDMMGAPPSSSTGPRSQARLSSTSPIRPNGRRWTVS